MKYEDFARWQDTKWKRRGQDYETYKQQLEQVLLNVVESRFPGFSELIEYKELSTPLTICDFTGHQQGAIYGYPLTPEVFSQRTFHPGTTIKNLYLTGTDVVALGVMGAFMGGVVTASHAMGGLPGFLKIMKAAGNS